MRLSQLLTTTLREVPRDTEGGNQAISARRLYTAVDLGYL